MLSKPPKEVWEHLILVTQLGLTFVGSVMLCLVTGWWLDGLLGSGKILTVIGMLLGLAGGAYQVWRQLKEVLDLDQKNGPEPPEDRL